MELIDGQLDGRKMKDEKRHQGQQLIFSVKIYTVNDLHKLS